MAARENQGYLIAVIILVLLTLILALAAFLGISKASEHASGKADFEHKLKLSNALSDANAIEAEILRAYVGGFGLSVAEVEPQIQTLKQLSATPGLEANERSLVQAVVDRVETIQQTYTGDMVGNVTMVDGEAAQSPTWRTHIDTLKQYLAKQNSDNAVQRRQTELSEKEAASDIKEMESTLAENQKTLAARDAELKAEKRRGLDKEADLQNQLDEAVAGNETVNKNFQTIQQQLSKSLNDMRDDKIVVEEKNQGLKERINLYEREVFDRPDGQIVKVASRLRICDINLGSADGLTANRTFSVYDKDVTNFDKGKHKAKIEVTSVGLYHSQALITDEDPTHPILAGDHILTATWDPGFSVSIALTGEFDLDGDQYDDRDKLAKMIERNGGKVAATHDDQGNMIGNIDPTVRYLVVGKPPTLSADADDGSKKNSSAINDTMRKMQDLAEKNTVELIDLQKLLNRMGVRARPKTLQIEPRIGGFPIREPGDAANQPNKNE